ncbi:hypothetical protein SRHO_G00222900 [Serrasalmus rhombeus]
MKAAPRFTSLLYVASLAYVKLFWHCAGLRFDSGRVLASVSHPSDHVTPPPTQIHTMEARHDYRISYPTQFYSQMVDDKGGLQTKHISLTFILYDAALSQKRPDFSPSRNERNLFPSGMQQTGLNHNAAGIDLLLAQDLCLWERESLCLRAHH